MMKWALFILSWLWAVPVWAQTSLEVDEAWLALGHYRPSFWSDTYTSTIQAIVLRIIEILKTAGCRIHIGTATMPTLLYNKILSYESILQFLSQTKKNS